MDPSPQPGDDPRLRRLIDYLEQHRQQINVEALRKELLRAGHPPELVDEAVRRVAGDEAGKPRAWPVGLLVMVANLIVMAPLLFGLIGATVSLVPAANDNLLWLPAPVLLVALIPVGELLAGRRLRGGPRDHLGRVLSWGATFTLIVMGLLLVLFGICVVLVISAFSY